MSDESIDDLAAEVLLLAGQLAWRTGQPISDVLRLAVAAVPDYPPGPTEVPRRPVETE